MAAHHLAQGLASLGRNGDSMLMHVTPNEVAGLKNLAKSMGGEVTTNPHTGLPEASFFDFMGNLMPMFAGMLLGPEVLGASMLGEGGLGLTGTALKAAETALPIVGGAGTAAIMDKDPLMGALGGYGGAGLGSSFAKMGTAGGYSGGVTAGDQVLANAPGAPGMNANLQAQLKPSFMTGTAAGAAPITAAEGFGNLTSGIGKLASDPTGNWQAFKDAGGSGMKLGLPIGMAALDAMQPEPVDMSEEQAKREAEKNKYRSSTGGLNLAASSGLNLGLPSLTLASGGVVNANQSTISTGGIQDLYGTSDNTTGNAPLSQDGYGIGRLDKLAQQGSLTKAGDMFYAAGGPVSFADGGDKGMNIDGLPSLNLNTGEQVAYVDPNAVTSVDTQKYIPGDMGLYFNNMLRKADGKDPIYANPESSGMDLYFKNLLNMGQGKDRIQPVHAPSAMQEYFKMVQNTGQKNKMAHGGYLDGAGDGMSDSIPATIEGQQPARLADGEFVVPADVVSHIGNGSSKAGSKRLYAMLDKVRKARTGHTKQGREINPNKYLPA